MLFSLLKSVFAKRQTTVAANRLFEQSVRWLEAGELDLAINGYQNTIKLDPTHARAHNNLAIICQERGDFDMAIVLYQKATQLDVSLTEPHMNLGYLCEQANDFKSAVEHYEQAQRADPKLIQAQFRKALALLALGDYVQGWKEYESRWQIKRSRTFEQPRLNDVQNISGQRILLYMEQGFGDAIQFIRYVPLLAARGAQIIVQCHPALGSLFEKVAGVAAVVTVIKPLPEFDYQAPLMSLPYLFRTTVETIPSRIPYLSAGSDKVSQWRNKLADYGAKLKIGLAWAGNPAFTGAAEKNCPPEALSLFTDIQRCIFFSLQIGSRAEQAHRLAGLVDLTSDIKDFEDTAALISELDLVITIDTAVAHLAGALGKPFWIMLASTPDWRWIPSSGTARWYPTSRIFRQQPLGSWIDVAQEIREALQTWIASA